MNKDLTQKDTIKQRTLKGLVVSDKMMKTVVVQVTRLVKHPKYKKYMKISKRFKAHDEENAYHTGEEVIIGASRPHSKEKRWVVIKSAKNV